MPHPIRLPKTIRAARVIAILPLILAFAPSARGKTEILDLFEGFGDGWRETWRNQTLVPFQRQTVYETDTDESGTTVLRGESRNAALGLLRPIGTKLPSHAVLRWRWKVAAPLMENSRERERRGDDFAARVFVVFETSMIPTRTRAINYVWSAHEPVGSEFPSPYTGRVGMIVVRSGAEEADTWAIEERNVLEDYRRFFGREPEVINAVALMVDTDDTGLAATAWFGDLMLEISAPDNDPQP